MNMSILFDAASMHAIRRIGEWQPDTRFHEAMTQSLDLLQNYAVNFMFSNFQNPSGALEGGFYQTITPGRHSIEGELANATPYAWRREAGFSGQTDSLGRFYPDDPGIAYLAHTLEDNTDNVRALFSDAVSLSLKDLGGA